MDPSHNSASCQHCANVNVEDADTNLVSEESEEDGRQYFVFNFTRKQQHMFCVELRSTN